jgi:hypothetical protein
MKKGAIISEDGQYRYALWRIWDKSLPLMLIIGVNPSTADAARDDPTIRKCIEMCRGWGYGGFLMGNLYAYRSPKPHVLARVTDPVGRDNDLYLMRMAKRAETILLAWGNNAALVKDRRADIVLERLAVAYREKLRMIATTGAGHPTHPLWAIIPERPREVSFI